MAEVSVLFVCMGNICRSPTAQGVFESALLEAGLTGGEVWVDSAGTHGFHRGHRPDARAQEAAARRGVDLSTQRSRRIVAKDFTTFDHIIAMDRVNLEALREQCPDDEQHRLSLFMEHALDDMGFAEVPDPYYGGLNGFECVLDLIEVGSSGLLLKISERLQQYRDEPPPESTDD